MANLTINHDTACFSDRNWFVGEYAFSSKKDAEEAIRLAGYYASTREESLRYNIKDAIDSIGADHG